MFIKMVETRELKAHISGKCMQTHRGTKQARWQQVNAYMVPRQLHQYTGHAC